MSTLRPIPAAVVACAALALVVPVLGQQPQAPPAGGAQDQVAALRQTMQEGLARIRQYEWTETTTISLKGDEKARKQNRCSYGADGKVQKVPLDQPKAAGEAKPSGGGRRGGRVKEHIVENKKDEMQDYMKRAAALIHKYVPPAPQQIQVAKDAGRIKTDKRGGAVVLAISDYLQKGDSLTLDVDPATHRLTALGVNTYLDKPDEPVTLAVRMAALPDGALYAAHTTLEASAKNIKVVIENAGHRQVAK